MRNLSYRLVLLAVLTMLAAGCKKKAWDEYYGRPDNLEPPIYQVLESKGNFKTLLAAIDKAGYKRTLSGAGYWTFFAPTDSAFDTYFKENNISGVAAMDSVACRKIVNYCLVYNAFKRERLGDYQANTGWVPNVAFRRRTAYYEGVYDGVNADGQTVKMIASNRNNNGTSYYVDADYNNKYIPYFVSNFMAGKTLTAADYNYFYPNTQYTGFNVANAKVTEQDIAAENGIVHVIDHVISALPGIDEYITKNPDYSEFKRLFDRYLLAYAINPTVTNNYRLLHGGNENVYIKIYAPNIAFSPNNENFLKMTDNDGQQNCYSMFVPNNAAFTAYLNSVLLENYANLESLPLPVVVDFVNAHMWQTAVWPSQFATSFNYVGEEARFNANTDVVDRKILSNGFFYGTNKVQEANVFTSVYGKAYLDPQFSMMTSLLNQELKFQISNIHQKFSIFLINNATLNAAGFFVDPTVDNNPALQWRYIPTNGGSHLTGSSALVRLLRVINLHVIPGVDLADLQNGSVALSYGGEFVKFQNNTVWAAGNLDSSNVANLVWKKTAKNGTANNINRVLNFSETVIGKHIEKLGTAAGSQHNYFWQFLRNSSIYTAANGDILNVAAGTFYTVFVPNNAAISQAVADGLLPGTPAAPAFNPASLADKEKVNSFIYNHILNKKTVATDGIESGSFETLYRNNAGEPGGVFVDNSVRNAMVLTDAHSRKSNIILAQSNFLSNRCVIHLIDNYLKY
ncbi:fasciclin domain-containing protein [Chitinophaga horti]|uniref:Fasciclin domain-containing protein n=1 Tax=Chitinophaga horti TaxID=2920382 RepID=A0ABY6J6X1_9BACT|nr:fasciclin domain-containing protein [Chitinophaga horti]UYQ94046.1 fasciclin domain-containing protein [Chitinophaga horti]